jgi:ACR3 family arsenite efflux pump ArsB
VWESISYFLCSFFFLGFLSFPSLCEIPSQFYTQNFLSLLLQLLADQANQIHISPHFFLALFFPLSIYFYFLFFCIFMFKKKQYQHQFNEKN